MPEPRIRPGPDGEGPKEGTALALGRLDGTAAGVRHCVRVLGVGTYWGMGTGARGVRRSCSSLAGLRLLSGWWRSSSGRARAPASPTPPGRPTRCSACARKSNGVLRIVNAGTGRKAVARSPWSWTTSPPGRQRRRQLGCASCAGDSVSQQPPPTHPERDTSSDSPRDFPRDGPGCRRSTRG